MIDPNEFLKVVQRQISRLVEEKEARRKWYEVTASKLLRAPVRVEFRSLDEFGEGTQGVCKRDGPDGWYIGILPGLPKVRECATWAHEVAHALCQHPRYLTKSQREHAGAMEAAIQSGELSKVTGFDCKLILNGLQEKIKHEADELGKKIFSIFWPNDCYTL